MSRILRPCAALAALTVFFSSLLVVSPEELFAAPSVGAPLAAPSPIPTGRPVQVLITSQIVTSQGDPAVVQNGVYLNKVDTAGKVLSQLGIMKDDGLNGDVLAGDKKYSLRITINQTAAGSLRLQVSAAFQRVVRRVLSSVTIVPISNVNKAPVITSIAPTSATMDFGYLYQIVASDADHPLNILLYSLVKGPAGMTLNSQSLSWLPSETQQGSFPVEIKVADPLGAFAVQTFSVNVDDFNFPPSIQSIPQTYAVTGKPYAYDIEAFDPENEALRYSIQSEIPPGLEINNATGLLKWTPGASDAGVERITVEATDPVGGFDSQTFNLTVYDASVSLNLISPKGSYEVRAGESLSIPLQANLAKALFSADPLPEHASLTAQNFVFNPVGEQAGDHVISFKTQAGEQSVSNVVTIKVIKDAAVNSPPELLPVIPQIVKEGEPLAFILNATDPDQDTLIFSAPGLSLPNAFFNQVSNQFLFNPGFDQAGVYNINFLVSDGIETDASTVQVTVSEKAPPVSALKLVVDPTPNPTLRSKLPITGSVTGETGGTPAPEPLLLITGLTPASATPGQSLDVTMTCIGTDLKQETAAASFGEGVTVETLQVLSPLSAKASIKVAQNAALGPRLVQITDGAVEVTSLVAFSIGEGSTSISGQVIDVFTTQPLQGAKVGINGTASFTTTNAEGRFTLPNAPTGTHTLVAMLTNYTVGKVGVTLDTGTALIIGEPIALNALARPAAAPGSLPRAATAASVLDRGITSKNGDMTLEDAAAVIQDTMLAVGGEDAGVLDSAGNQLNPKVTGFGSVTLTQEGVLAQARALILGDVFTVGEFHIVLTNAFAFPLGLSINEFISGLQQAADEAWANPANPENAMALVLFNEGTSLSTTPPVITDGTRLNRFQIFLLATSFLAFNRNSLETSVESMLKANNIDAEALLPPSPFPVPGSGGTGGSTPSGGGGLGGIGFAMLNFGIPDAWAQAGGVTCPPANNTTIPCNIGDLSARRTFTKVYRTIGANAIAEAHTGALFSAGMAVMQQAFIGFTIGMTGGTVGAALGATLAVAAAYAQGWAAILFNKLVMGWYLAIVAASFEPPAPEGRSSALAEDGSFVISFDRSSAEFDQPQQNGPNKIKKSLTYHLYRFPNCGPVNFGQSEYVPLEFDEDNGHPQNQRDPKSGPLRFVVPKAMLKAGRNHFRVRSFQHIHNSTQPLVEGMELYDSNEDGLLNLDEFRRGGFGDHLSFNPADKNHDGKIDSAEFPNVPNPNRVPSTIETDSGLPEKRVGVAIGKINITPEDYQSRLAGEKIDIKQNVYQAEIEDTRQNLANLRKAQSNLSDSAQFIKDNEEAFKLNRDIVIQAEQRSKALLTVSGADATTQLKAAAPIVAEEVFQRHYGRSTTPALTKLVEETLLTYREVNMSRANMEAQYDAMKEVTRAVQKVKTGGSLEETVQVPTRRFFDKFGVLETQTLKITPANAAELDVDLRTPAFESFGKGRQSPVVFGLVLFEGAVGDLAVGGLAEDEIFVGRKANSTTPSIGNLNYELVRGGIAAKTGLTPAQVEAQLNSMKSDVVEAGIRSQGLTQEIQDEEFRLRNLNKLQKLSTPIDFPVGVSRNAPRIERPAGLSPIFERGIGGTVGVGGEILGNASTLVTLIDSIKVLGSEFSEACFATGSAATAPNELFPPPIEAYPRFEQSNAVIRAEKTGAKTGAFVVSYPGVHHVHMAADTGFPPGPFTTDDQGRLYAVNMASAEKFGGRIFRYTIQPSTQRGEFPLTRELIGAVNYFSMMIQLARPANPVAMTAGPPIIAQNESGAFVNTQDLFVANFDIVDGKKQILKVYTSLADLKPSYYSEAAGNRHRIVGQQIILDEQLELTGPSDMVTGPDPDVAEPFTQGNSAILLSDEDTIFAILRQPGTENYTLVPVIREDARRWSGMAFDRLGRFYFADFQSGDIFMMTWENLRASILASRQSGQASITGTIQLKEKAYRIAAALDRPGDLELESFSAYPQAILHVSTFNGVLPVTLPIIGRLDQIENAVISRFSVEDEIARDGTYNTFRIVPSREDLTVMRSILRVQATDSEGRKSWKQRNILLSEKGATIITEPLK